MAIFTSPNLFPLLRYFGWTHSAKISGYENTACPSDCPEYGSVTSIEAAMQIATVWACIRLLSETVATLPIFVYQTKGDKKVVAKNHPLFELLHDEPNIDMTALEFWEGVVVSLCTVGNAYAEKKRINGRLVALNPMQADAVGVSRTARGRRLYHYNQNGQKTRELDEDDVFHVRGFGNGGDVGLSPISYARYTLFGARMADRTSAQGFASGNRQHGVLSAEQVLKADQRKDIRENILKPFLEGKTLVLEAGMKFTPTSLSPEDSQMLESRKFQIEEICRWFRVPPFMIGHTEKSTSWGTGLEQQQIAFLTFALEPYLERIEQAIRRSLIPRQERQILSAEFKVEKLLRADSQARAAYYKAALGNTQEPGWMVKNEVRRLENMEPLDGGDVPVPVITNVPAKGVPA